MGDGVIRGKGLGCAAEGHWENTRISQELRSMAFYPRPKEKLEDVNIRNLDNNLLDPLTALPLLLN